MEKTIQAEVDAETEEKAEVVKQEAAQKLDELKANQFSDPAAYREEAERVRREKEEELERIEKEAEQVKQERFKGAAEEVRRKRAQGAQTKEELDQDIIKNMGVDGAEGTEKLEAAKQARAEALEEAKRQQKE